MTFSYSGETITKKQIFSARVSSNYHLSDVYVYIYDDAGTEVLKHAYRIRVPSTMETKIYKDGGTYTWGDWDDLSPDGEYTAKIEVQLGTGERPVLWEGKFIVE